ncbi:YidH family protein [Rhodococcus sp. NPDC057014]|uniref:YidH family protein n=1 Tax=Rhodococcus sp. NPDC057014 TaxID=3346000 RepID=UPI0036268FD5
MTQLQKRWPKWVYVQSAEEPDYRFSFANERTFLAWIRTSLALLAVAVAVDVVDLALSDLVRKLLAALLVGSSLLCSIIAWTRWAASERAIRLREPLPPFRIAILLCSGLLVVGSIVMATVATS